MEENEAPITFADLGINAPKSTKDTCLGKIRHFSSFTKLEIAFLVVSLLSLLACLGLTIERAITSSTSSADFTFALLLILNVCFCLYYVLNGIFFERPYEIAILVLGTFVMWIYLLLNYIISVKGPFKLARLIISSTLSPCVIVMGGVIFKNYHESKNLIFRTVGAQASLQDICRTMFIFFDLLKADLQVSFSLALLILASVEKLNLEDKILLPLALCFGFASFIAGYFSVRFENKPLIFIYFGLWVIMPAYAIFLVVMAAQDLRSPTITQMQTSLNGVKFVAAIICLVVRGACIFYGLKAFFNFGKGLRQKVYGILEDIKPAVLNEDYPHETA